MSAYLTPHKSSFALKNPYRSFSTSDPGTSSVRPGLDCSHPSTRWSVSVSPPPARPRPRRASAWPWGCHPWPTVPAARPSALLALWLPRWAGGPAALAWWEIHRHKYTHTPMYFHNYNCKSNGLVWAHPLKCLPGSWSERTTIPKCLREKNDRRTQ